MDADPDTAILAESFKLLGNSAYGSLIMAKECHRNITYVCGDANARKLVNQPTFRAMTKELESDIFEVEKSKSRIIQDLPIVLVYMILQYTKLKLLCFEYDCLQVTFRAQHIKY